MWWRVPIFVLLAAALFGHEAIGDWWRGRTDPCREARASPEYRAASRDHDQRLRAARAAISAHFAERMVGQTVEREAQLANQAEDEDRRLVLDALRQWSFTDQRFCAAYAGRGVQGQANAMR